MWGGLIDRISIAKHEIELARNSNLVHLTPYRAGATARGFQRLEIEKVLSHNVIEPAETEWEATILFAPKKDRFLRLCVDNRKLNNLG